MKVKVKFFAALRERVGTSEVTKEIGTGSTVGDLWKALQVEYEKLVPIQISLLYAVNQEYVDADYVLEDRDEVVFVPPVSGG